MRNLALLLLFLAYSSAEVIDRIAVSVGNQIITQADITADIRVTAFLNHQKPEYGPDQRRDAADRLIKQLLIKREMNFSRFPLPAKTDADPLLKQVQADYRNQAQFTAALASAGVTEAELTEHLWWQLTTLRFIEYRFQPSVQIPESRLRAYYRRQLPELTKQNNGQAPAFEEARPAIEKVVTQEEVDRALNRWLNDTRIQLDIVYRDRAFE